MESVDPNNIQGPSGFGTKGFVKPELFSYGIEFQNKPTATAPAQTVTVTQQLDANLDWTTFQLGDIGFGDTVVNVPSGQTSYSTQVDLTATRGIYVDVTANFNPLTGVATWTFTSIDPATLDVPADPLAGFLPPDDSAGDGTGFVNYTIVPKTSLTTGAAINGQASVVFDMNGAIQTAQILNTIDSLPPTSSVAPLPPQSPTTFNVGWSGSDDPGGSGIASYDVYVSDNGAPFTRWLTGTTKTSASYTGVFGHTYGFYSVATDNVGNVQPTPTAAQATTEATNLIASPATVTATEGVLFSGEVATVTDANASPALAATVTWDDGTTSLGTVTGPDANGVYTVSASHTFAEETSGTTLTVAVSDGSGATATATCTATVSDAPLTGGAVTIAPAEGATFTGAVATFTDTDPNGIISDYTATIGWGDGATTSGTVTTAVSGGFAIVGSHAYAEEGTQSVTVTVADAGGSTTTAISTAHVADAGLSPSGVTIAATEDTIFSGTVATFTDADPNGAIGDYTATIAWGDGATIAGTVTAAPGGFAITGSHGYAEEATRSVTVTVSDAGGSTATAVGTADIADAPLKALGVTIATTEGTTFSGTVATFTDTDPNGALGDYAATIVWGDGATTSGTVSAASGGGFAVAGSHAYTEGGTLSLTVTIADAGGAAATADGTATVAVPLTIVSLGAIATDPRNVYMASDDVTFTEPINLTNFDFSAISLTLNGGTDLINSGVTISLVSGTTDTYRIAGLETLTATDGNYVLSVDASKVQDLNGNYGTGTASVGWLMDTTPPTSKVNSLPATETAYSFTVSVAGSDPPPASEPGIVTSGVASYAIYAAIDNGPFAIWTTVPAGSPSATYTGQPKHHYYFRSVATDAAGNIESKPAVIEAGTYVPDLTPPVTKIASATVNVATNLFTLKLSGSDVGGSGLATFNVYVQVDPDGAGSTVQQIATVAAGSPDANGNYSGVATYQVPASLLDGQPHTYRFFSTGTDGARNVEAPHSAPNDVESTQVLSPQPLAVSNLVIEKGLVERSYIRYIDIGFDETGATLQNLIDNNDIRLIHHPLSGVISPTDPTVPLAGLLKVIDDALGNADMIEIDFGALGLGGAPAGAISTYWSALEAGDGYYELDLDLDGSGEFATHEFFYRLLGDVNGDQVVNGGDLNAITAALGQTGPLLNADVNGDGRVNSTDKALAYKSQNNGLTKGLYLDD